MKNYKAFTLAEMLISFVIVAIISALFMMSFKATGPKENIMNYKKAFSTVQQVVAQMASDREAFPDGDKIFKVNATINATSGARTFEMEKLSDTDDPATPDINESEIDTTVFKENKSSTYFCNEFVRRLNTVTTREGGSMLQPSCKTGGKITLSNGIQLIDVGGKNFSGEKRKIVIK